MNCIVSVNPKELYDFLNEKNFKYFFHANSVTTACTFIEQKGILSRGYVEAKELVQTIQSSDNKDKEFNVWNDIFVDLFDLHGYFPRQNLYGPVCFVLDNKFLLDDKLPNICITKDNPIRWNNLMSDNDKYYFSVSEYAEDFKQAKAQRCLQQKMFTIHETDKKIPLKKYLVKIILDNPKVKVNNINLFNEAQNALYESLEKADFNSEVLETRNCYKCFCHKNYLNSVSTDDLRKFFLKSN